MSDVQLADLADFEARYPRALESDERRRAVALLEDAANILRAEFGRDWLNDDDTAVEDPVVTTVCVAMATRAFDNPEGITSYTTGTYSETRQATPNAVYLTDDERALLAKIASGTISGVWTLGTTRGPVEMARRCGDTTFLDTVYAGGGAGEPIPWDEA